MECNISIILDKRRKKDNLKFPVKLRVYNKQNKKVKHYPLDIDFSSNEFENIWINSDNKKLRGSNKQLRLKLQSIETKANNVAEDLTSFSFDLFEAKLFRKSSDKKNVQYHFNQVIGRKIRSNKIGTAESYKYTLNSLSNFCESERNCKIDKLRFDDISVEWLKDYEAYMISENRSFSTISIYTRTLRAIFNNAISSNDISKDLYPFGEKKYRIPKASKVKKALNSEQLKTLFNCEPTNNYEEKAKDFWFLSYACNGMNIKDIALLEYSNVDADKFTYYRAKTIDSKAEKILITIYLNDFTQGIIEKYGRKYKNGLVFDIVDENEDGLTQYKKIKNFTRFINDHIKKIAIKNGLPEEISAYWARHSFATNSLRKGASMEFISEALSHSSLEVTKNYFAGFEDDAKKDFAMKILDF